MTASPIRSVHALTTGEVRLRPKNIAGTGTPMLWWTFTSRRWSAPLPVLAFLIEHERGPILWDTGQAPEVGTDGYFPGGLVGAVYRRQVRSTVAPGQTLTAQLAAVGRTPQELRLAALSHLHYDHAGNVGELSGVPILLSSAEHALLSTASPEQHGVLTRHVLPDGVDYRPVEFVPLADPALAAFGVGHDVLGDGSLVLLPTPGHSAGSMSLLVRRDPAPPLLLVGDVTYDPELLAAGVLPDVGVRSVQQETADRIRRLADALPGLVILAAHDPRAAARLAAA